MRIEHHTDDELRNEIERRKISATKPKAFPSDEISLQDLINLRGMCVDYIESLAGGCHFKDPEYMIFERCISMFYGASVWEWINERIE